MFDYFYGPQAEQFAFYRVPKVLFTNDRFKYLSAEAKTLYGILLDRVPLSAKNGWIDEQGRVYIICTIEEIIADMNCGNKKAIQLLSDLEDKVGLIERKRQGLGKPNLIYVKNFISVDNPVERHFLKCQNDTSGSIENTSLEVSKGHGNKTDIMNTEYSDTDSFYSGRSVGKGSEAMRIRTHYEDYFRESLELDYLSRDEMTHQKLHSIDPTAKTNPAEPKLTRNHKEVEAESVAFTVCQHYGIDTGDYSFAYVAGWSHGKETPELKASLDKIRKTASEMITEIDEHLAALQKEYAWAHLTADDVKNIECTGSEYMPHSRMAEHTFSCEIVGEPMTLKLTVSQHDDGEGFTIHSEGKDVWDTIPESGLRKLEPLLTSTAELHYWTSQIEKAETAEAVKEVSFGFMEAENLGLSREQCQKFWKVVDQKESSLSPPSTLADLQAKKEKSEKEMSSKPKTKASQKKSKKQKKEESR